MFELQRHADNPVLIPHLDHPWENFAVCNPAVWYEDGRFLMLYRAAGDDPVHRIHLGLATSDDGVHFTRATTEPVFSPLPGNFDGGCVEDPRIVKFGDWFYITYAYRPLPPGRYWLNEQSLAYMPQEPAEAPVFYRQNMTQSGLLMSRDLKTFQRLGRITAAGDDNRDVILFPEKVNDQFVMLHRSKRLVGDRYGCEYPSIWIAFSNDLLSWDDGMLLLKNQFDWESKVGGATPPIRTEAGWLMLYHAVDDAGVYRTGACLLDLNNPTQVLARLPEPILAPLEAFELNGLYGQCVFPTGNVVVGDSLYIYYGAADKCIGLATCQISDLLESLKNCREYKQ